MRLNKLRIRINFLTVELSYIKDQDPNSQSRISPNFSYPINCTRRKKCPDELSLSGLQNLQNLSKPSFILNKQHLIPNVQPRHWR